MRRLLLIVTLLGCACAYHEKAISKGEAIDAMLSAYCNQSAFQMNLSNGWVYKCEEDNKHNFCERDNSCNKSLADGAECDLDDCIETISQGMECNEGSLFCVMPFECGPIWLKIFSDN